jgi:hypothetical protein
MWTTSKGIADEVAALIDTLGVRDFYPVVHVMVFHLGEKRQCGGEALRHHIRVTYWHCCCLSDGWERMP